MTNIIRDLHLTHGCFEWLEAGDASSFYPSNNSVHDNNGGWNQVGSRNKGKKKQTGSEFQNSKMQKMASRMLMYKAGLRWGSSPRTTNHFRGKRRSRAKGGEDESSKENETTWRVQENWQSKCHHVKETSK